MSISKAAIYSERKTTMHKRIAIIGSRGFPSTYGGFETLVRVLAPYLVERGHDVTVYGRGGRSKTHTHIDGVGVVECRGLNSKSLSTASHGLTSALHARTSNYDSALLLNVANGPFLPILTRAGIPTAVNVDGVEWLRGKWGRLAKAAFRQGAVSTARNATEIIVDSQAIGDFWQSEFGRRGVFIPYGAAVSHDTPDTPIREIGLSPGFVLLVARIAPENNIDLFLDACNYLDPSITIVVVGSANYDTPISRRLQSLADSRTNFRWLGHVADQELLSSLWAHCGVYFHGHSVGGTNPALLQAMGLGAPVVAFDSIYNREVVGEAALLSSDDPRELGIALTGVLSDLQVRRELAAKAKQRIAADYSWPDVCERYEEVLTAIAR